VRSFSVFVCCLAVGSVAVAQPVDQHKKKHRAQAGQQQQEQPAQQQQVAKPGKRGLRNTPRGGTSPQAQSQHWLKGQEQKFRSGQSKTAKHQVKHFDLKTGPKPDIASVKFRENNRIEGSDRWQGAKYNAFRAYRAQWHDRQWWRRHHTRIVLIGGGWYFWNAGFWYPAWGYDPGYAYYPYDGPIYAYNDLPPDQVIANVQAALQEEGYYQGEVDGLLGPLTRAALADYQREHGLYTTAAIDEPTLDSLGLT
jgi:hypothetical protein